ncbi:MAG: methyltransferase domain-containing protein [Candidatus Aminicenantales bacterium]
MKRDLLKYIVCPGCRTPMKLSSVEKTEGAEILESSLSCPSCGISFPVRRGVPRLLIRSDLHLQEETKKNFAFSWEKFSEIYDDPKDFLDWIYPKTRDFFKGKIVLDAGCGSGKHAVFASEFGAKEVIAFDLSPSVDVAFKHSRSRDNVHVIQADIYNLPLREDCDFIYCIGVLQHLPDTEQGFLKLRRHLKPAGWISVWVYGYEGTGFIRQFIDPIRRAVTTRLPLMLTFSLSFLLTAVFYFLAKVIYGPLAKFKRTKVLSKKLPLGDYISYVSQFNFSYLFNVVFDQLIAPITQYFRQEEVRSWFKKADLEKIRLFRRNNMSWRATGQNPD